MSTSGDFTSEPTRIVPPPTRALAAAIWPHLFASPAPCHITELSPEEVAEIVGADCRATVELPAFTEE